MLQGFHEQLNVYKKGGKRESIIHIPEAEMSFFRIGTKSVKSEFILHRQQNLLFNPLAKQQAPT